MSDPQSPDKEQREEQVMDALLGALFENETQRAQDLVDGGMQRLDGKASSMPQDSDVNTTPLRKSARRWPFLAAAAAVLLLAALIPFFDSSGNAMAAVSRSLQSAMEDVGRHYSVSTRLSLGQKKLDTQADLYVKGAQRFAYRSDSPMDALPVWLGNDHGQSWVVPPIGPVLLGDPASLNEWAEEESEITTPYLHVTSFLRRMQDSYVLTKLPNEPLETSLGIVDCQHISGELTQPGARGLKSGKPLPVHLELWAHAQTGVAMKATASWNLDGNIGRESVTIEFLEEVKLTDEFFTPDAHGGQDRPRLGFDPSRR